MPLKLKEKPVWNGVGIIPKVYKVYIILCKSFLSNL